MRKKRQKAKYYESLSTIPIAIFHGILSGDREKGDIVIEGKLSKAKLDTAWRSLMQEYVAEFGVSEEYQYYLESLQSVLHYCKKAIDSPAMTSVARMKWKKVRSLLKKPEDEKTQSFAGLVAEVTRFMGIVIDPNTVSAMTFYGYLESMRKENKAHVQRKREERSNKI